MNQTSEAPKNAMQRILDVVEKVGNKVPHPVIIFLILIAIVVVLSHVLYMTGTSVSSEVIVPLAAATDSAAETEADFDESAYDAGVSADYREMDEKKYKIETRTIEAKSLLTKDGIRFIYSSLIPSFMGFTAVGLIIVAMVGVGVAEESGLVNALIRKLVIVSPRGALAYI